MGFKVVEYEINGIGVFVKGKDGITQLTGDIAISFVERQTVGSDEYTIWEFSVPDTMDWSDIRGVEMYDEYKDSIGYIPLNGAIVDIKTKFDKRYSSTGILAY
jgi:hypothetical protein